MQVEQPFQQAPADQRDMNVLRNNLNALADTVNALQSDIGNINSSNQRTEARLARIDETNNTLVQSNTEALRSFIRGDIQQIIASHVETNLIEHKLIKKRKVDGVDDVSDNDSNNNHSSTHTSVYVPPIVVANSQPPSAPRNQHRSQPPPPPPLPTPTQASAADPSTTQATAPAPAPVPSPVPVQPAAPQATSQVVAAAPAATAVPASSSGQPDLATILQGVIKAVAPKEKLVLPKLSKPTKAAYIT